MDQKFIDYLEKTGQKDVATLIINAADKAPDEFEVDKAAKDYLDSRAAIYKSSDDFKNLTKEQKILAEKEVNKYYNEALGLGLSKEEAGKLGREEIAKILKDKHEIQLKESQNGHTKEWQDKHAQAIAESTKLKKLLEDTEANYKKQVEEANGKYELRVKEESINKAFNEAIEKQDWGTDPGAKARKEVATVYLKTKFNESGIKWKEDGKIYKGENDVVTALDGVTRLDDLDKAIKSYGKDAALFAQANTGGNDKGGGQPTTFTPTGNAAFDQYTQQQIEHNAKMNAGNFGK